MKNLKRIRMLCVLAIVLFPTVAVNAETGGTDGFSARSRTLEYSGPNARITNDVQRPSSLIRRDPVTNGFEYRDKPAGMDATEARAKVLKDRLQQDSLARAERNRDLKSGVNE